MSPLVVGKLLRTVSLPHLRRHRLRTTSTVLGIALGVAVLVAVLIINRSILDSVASTIDDVAGKAELQVRSGSAGFSEKLLETVRDTPGVTRATLVLEQTVAVAGPEADGDKLLVLGVDLLNADEDYFRSYDSPDLKAIETDPVVFLNSPYHIILGRAVAERFGYRLHDRISLQTPSGAHPFEIWGFVEDEGAGHAFGGSFAVMDYGAMQLAFDRGRNVDRIDVATAAGADTSTVAEKLRGRLGAGFSVARPERKNERVAQMLQTLQSGLTTGSLVALLVGMFLVHNAMTISVVQRRREIGILRAIGARRSDVTLLLTLEGALLGAAGSALGLLFGIALARALLGEITWTVNSMFLPIASAQLETGPVVLAGAWGLGVLVATAAALLPAREAASVTPVEALRPPASTPVAQSRGLARRDAAAAGLLLASALMVRAPRVRGLPLGPIAACLALLFAAVLLAPRLVQLIQLVMRPVLVWVGGVEARVANDNLSRDLHRSSATALALMVGVAMATAFAAFVGSFVSSTVDWVDQMLPADLWITSGARMSGGGASLPMAQSLAAPLGQIDGVETVERVRMPDAEYRGYPIKLVATDLSAAGTKRSHWLMLEGDQADAQRSVRRGGVVVSENFSRRFDVHRGDRIALAVRDGTRQFDVAGVMIDYTSDVGVVLLGYPSYVELWGDDRVDTYKLYLEPGLDPESVRRAVYRRFPQRHDLFVLTNREFRDEILSMLSQAFAVMYLLEIVATVIAVLGVVNALLANVLDRRREIGVLRAVGMLEGQVRKMIVVEGALVGLAGTLGGILLGLSIGHVLLEYINVVQTGWYLPYRPSWVAIAETAGVVAVGSALAGWYPAKQAADLAVTEALAYE